MKLNLRDCRRNKNMTQQQVSDLLGVDRTTYTLYENGKVQPTVEKMKQIAKIFDISLSDLLDPLEDDPTVLPYIPPVQMLASPSRDQADSLLDDSTFLFRFRLLTDAAKREVLAYMETKPLREDALACQPVPEAQGSERLPAKDAPDGSGAEEPDADLF
ncbi:MAG: helix-turn-helix transcriptional regulator [Clostridia bacterium]|nr:helix-turn-helix transcriptional regulator [Clostridia bacterium]